MGEEGRSLANVCVGMVLDGRCMLRVGLELGGKIVWARRDAGFSLSIEISILSVACIGDVL